MERASFLIQRQNNNDSGGYSPLCIGPTLSWISSGTWARLSSRMGRRNWGGDGLPPRRIHCPLHLGPVQLLLPEHQRHLGGIRELCTAWVSEDAGGRSQSWKRFQRVRKVDLWHRQGSWGRVVLGLHPGPGWWLWVGQQPAWWRLAGELPCSSPGAGMVWCPMWSFEPPNVSEVLQINIMKNPSKLDNFE